MAHGVSLRKRNYRAAESDGLSLCSYTISDEPDFRRVRTEKNEKKKEVKKERMEERRKQKKKTQKNTHSIHSKNEIDPFVNEHSTFPIS